MVARLAFRVSSWIPEIVGAVEDHKFGNLLHVYVYLAPIQIEYDHVLYISTVFKL